MPQWVPMLRRPLRSATTISPGRTSRTKRAPTASSAQDSDAKAQPAPFGSSPMHSGRNPLGSRAAISLVWDMMTRLYAPLMMSIVSLTAVSMFLAVSRFWVRI